MSRTAPRIILGVLAEQGRPVSRTRLMKLLFLLRQDTNIGETAAFYDFLPYKFGPYSFFVDCDLRNLQENGFVTCTDDSHLVPTPTGLAAYETLPPAIQYTVQKTVRKVDGLATAQLMDLVYLRFPQFTILSEREGCCPPPRPEATRAVHTIGYEGVTVDGFLNALVEHGIRRLIDVRNNPLSRNFGYSKKTLSDLCARISVEYIHRPELGIPSAQRTNLQDMGDYERLFDWYQATVLPERVVEIGQVATLMQEKTSALMCFEREPGCCHRSRLALRVAERSGLSIRHLEVGTCGSEKKF